MAEAANQEGQAGQPCQLCDKGEQATHQCVECAQALCATCQQTHVTAQTSHTVQPLTPVPAATPAPTPAPGGGGGGGGGRGRFVPSDGRCIRHKDQLVLLYCSQCQMTLCMVCKLTSHVDHQTEDLMDTGKKARAELTEELQVVTKREQILRAFLLKAQDFEDDIHKDKQGIEEKIQDRVVELRQMVDRAQADALETVAATTGKALKELKEKVVPIEERHAQTEAKLQNITRVVNDGEDGETVNLLAQLQDEAGQADKPRTECLLVERGTTRHEFRIRAVKFTNVLAFVGSAVEGPVMEAKASAIGAEPLEVSLRPGLQPPSDSQFGSQRITQTRRSTPVVIFYSKNPRSTLSAMHLMSTDDDFWLNFNPGGNVPLFGFFDDDGHMKEVHSENVPSTTVLITCDGDTIVSMTNGRWVRPGYQSGALETFTSWEGTAASKSSTPYLLKQQSIFRLLSDALPPQIDADPTYTTDAVATTFDVSETGQFVATTVENTVKVYDKVEGSAALRSYADYVETNGGAPSDVCFCLTEGKEVLMVAYSALNTVHIVDHRDGCCFIRTLETDKHPLKSPCRLATNHHGRVWVGCNGGRVVIFDI